MLQNCLGRRLKVRKEAPVWCMMVLISRVRLGEGTGSLKSVCWILGHLIATGHGSGEHHSQSLIMFPAYFAWGWFPTQLSWPASGFMLSPLETSEIFQPLWLRERGENQKLVLKLYTCPVQLGCHLPLWWAVQGHQRAMVRSRSMLSDKGHWISPSPHPLQGMSQALSTDSHFCPLWHHSSWIEIQMCWDLPGKGFGASDRRACPQLTWA